MPSRVARCVPSLCCLALLLLGDVMAGASRFMAHLARSESRRHFARERTARSLVRTGAAPQMESQGARQRFLERLDRRWPHLHDGRRTKCQDRLQRRPRRPGAAAEAAAAAAWAARAIAALLPSTSTRARPSGRPRWPRATRTARPPVDGDRVYALGRNGELACLDATDGKIVWAKDFPKQLRRQNDVRVGLQRVPLGRRRQTALHARGARTR